MTDRKGKLSPRRMIRLQAKLNEIFVWKRDSGASTAQIYRQLTLVERWLSDRSIFWPPYDRPAGRKALREEE